MIRSASAGASLAARSAKGRTGTRDGAGLGLSIARSIAAAHEATVLVRSQPEGGLDVRVTLPGRDAAAGSR
jgi:signal transduction histidine kinase